MITAYLITLHVLSAFGILGMVDVQFFQGRIGVYLARVFPWTF